MGDRLAIDGGTPVRDTLLPYGRQTVEREDLDAVMEVLKSDWLTTGPAVSRFEQALTEVTGAHAAIAVSNGTAALHAAMNAIRIQPGDEVIVPAITFAASANAVVYEGGTPVFADVDPASLLLTASEVDRLVTDRTRAVVAVDYAGQPCDYDALNEVCRTRGLTLVADAAHSLGASYRGRAVGTLAHLTTFSFHPVKHITTGEGGAVTTNDTEAATVLRRFRNHGITTEHRERTSWTYDMVDLGYNYRLSDLQCALGTRQLQRLRGWVDRRRQLAHRYDAALRSVPEVAPLEVRPERDPSWHLYVVRLDLNGLRVDRGQVFRALRAENIGVNVHYVPVPWHPYYQERGYHRGQWPHAEAAAQEIITLPLFHGMTEADADDVVAAVQRVVTAYRV